MSKEGEQLLAPESGWKRIDDRDSNIVYNGTGWVKSTVDSIYEYYNNTASYTPIVGDSIDIYFKSNKIRIIVCMTYKIPQQKNIKFVLNDKEIDYKSFYKNSGNKQGSWVAYEKTNIENSINHLHIVATSTGGIYDYLTFDAVDIDENGKLLTREEYNKMTSDYIKQNNKYYSFSKDNYDATTKMYREITLDDINNGLYPCRLTDLISEVTIGEETFKPIDKFDNFQFVSKYNIQKTIIGRKSKTGMSIASGDIYTKVTSRINSITLDNTVNNNSYIKMAVSFDNGITWKTYKDKKFTDLSINIAIKTYENMTTDEKNNWKSAKETILSEGFTPDILSTIDFNTIENLNTIRFAYVLYQDLYTDTCNVDNLSWNFNAKGKFTKLKENEADISFSNGVIMIEPTANFDMILTNYTYNE